MDLDPQVFPRIRHMSRVLTGLMLHGTKPQSAHFTRSQQDSSQESVTEVIRFNGAESLRIELDSDIGNMLRTSHAIEQSPIVVLTAAIAVLWHFFYAIL